jgi:uncharacterized protein (DUF2141 family)
MTSLFFLGIISKKGYKLKKLFFLPALLLSYDLEVKFKNPESGEFRIALYKTEKNFRSTKEYFRSKVTFKNSYTFRGVPSGIYAVALFHDKNGNGELDKNFFGIPTEDYGFSNNPRVLFSAPDFDECKFELFENRSLDIEVK